MLVATSAFTVSDRQSVQPTDNIVLETTFIEFQGDDGRFSKPSWNFSLAPVHEGPNRILVTFAINTNKNCSNWVFDSFTTSVDPTNPLKILGVVKMRVSENPSYDNQGFVTGTGMLNIEGVDVQNTELEVELLDPEGKVSSLYGRKKRGLMAYEP